MQKEREQFVSTKILDFVHVDPSPILNLQLQQQRLFVSRQHYSEIYQVGKNQRAEPVIQQIAQLQPSLYLLSVNSVIALFQHHSLQLLRNGRWEHHPFTTQLLSLRITPQHLYSFHQKETMQWSLSEDHVSYSYISQNQAPYHIDVHGSLTGYGKKVKQIQKGSLLTRCEVIQDKWVFVGDERGALHVYDWKFLSHVKTFHEHKAPILAIRVSEDNETVYFSGSDSRVGMIRCVEGDWRLGEGVRGQSHDIMALELSEEYLLSGGLTTDLCFYPLVNGQFEGGFLHRVSYCSVNRVSNEGRFMVVNHRNAFEIWSIGVNLYRTELIVRYQMPSNKFIVDARLFRQPIEEGVSLLLVVTDEDVVGWKFSMEHGLVKYITIQNQYGIVQLLPKYCFLGVRRDGQLQRVNCLSGKIQQLLNCQVCLPTDLQYMGAGLVLVASKVFATLTVINIRKREVVKELSFRETICYIDHYDHNQLLIQYFNTPSLIKFSLQDEKEIQQVQLPVSIIRFGGWLHSVTHREEKQLKSKAKKYWFGVSEGKLVVVPNLMKEGKKKVRVRQTDRIAQVIRPTSKAMGCNLALIPYNFARMVQQMQVRPVFTKKIV